MQLLLEGCRRKDRQSQRLLYQHYYPYAMSICLRYCRSRDEAKEVLNDGFMKVFNKIESYNSDTSFKAWLRRIMINTAIDNYRKESKNYNMTDVEDVELQNDEVGIVNELSYSEMLELINKLSPAARAVFNLHVIDGYTHEEIGLILGISEGTSKSNLVKARRRLRKMLEQTNRIYEKYV